VVVDQWWEVAWQGSEGVASATSGQRGVGRAGEAGCQSRKIDGARKKHGGWPTRGEQGQRGGVRRRKTDGARKIRGRSMEGAQQELVGPTGGGGPMVGGGLVGQ
jgi:hypothetical protein